MNKYTLAYVNEQKCFQVSKNDQPAICSYRTPVMMKGLTEGSVNQMDFACNTRCVHCELRQSPTQGDSKQIEVLLTCGSEKILKIENPEELEKAKGESNMPDMRVISTEGGEA